MFHILCDTNLTLRGYSPVHPTAPPLCTGGDAKLRRHAGDLLIGRNGLGYRPYRVRTRIRVRDMVIGYC